MNVPGVPLFHGDNVARPERMSAPSKNSRDPCCVCPVNSCWPLAILSAFGVLFFTWFGWGHWGFCVIGDYCLDMADALRVFQGDRPYRDFLPTYGALHMTLTAPLFHLGRFFFPTLWILTSILIFIQLLVLARLGRRLFSSIIWRIVLIGLAIASMAYIPTNSKFVLGYSQSGFLASLLGAFGLAFLGSPSPSRPRWILAGVCLGFIPFTKLDLGITSLAVVIVVSLVWWKTARSSVAGLLAAYASTWMIVCLLLFLWAGRLDLLVGSAVEAFGQAGFFNDEQLSRRIKIFMILGLVLLAGLAIRGLRPLVLRLERGLRPWSPLMLPLALFADAERAARMGAVKQMVILNWFWILVFVLVGAHLGAAVIRRRSLRPLRCGPCGLLLPLWVMTGMGLLRVLGAGWYPLNYFQPAPLLLGLLWLAGPSFHKKMPIPSVLNSVLLLGLLVQAWTAAQSCRAGPYSLERLSTPFGDVGFSLGPQWKQNCERILHKLQPNQKDDSLLCTYEPSWYLLANMRSAGFYTYFTRLGLSGRCREERERQSLQLFKDRRPSFILQGREVGPVHRRFGVDFGQEIAHDIEEHYFVIERLESITLYQRKPDS